MSHWFAPIRTALRRWRIAHLNRQVNACAADLADALDWRDRCQLWDAKLARQQAAMASMAALPQNRQPPCGRA